MYNICDRIMVTKSLEAARILVNERVNIRVVDIHTLKPIDKNIIIESAKKTGAVVTVEDHNIIGGLGGAVSEVISSIYPVPIERIGIKDVFGESGDSELLFTDYGMNVKHIIEGVKRAIFRKNK